MYLSCSTLVFAKDEYPDIADVVKKIRGMGLGALDLAAMAGWQNVEPSELVKGSEFWMKEFPGVVAEHEMKVSSLNSAPSKQVNDPDPAAREQYDKEYAALLDLANALDCPNITVHPGQVREDQGFVKSFDLAVEHLAEVGKLNEGRGVTLEVEAHAGSLVEKPEDALRMLKSLWPGVGLTYDPSHFVMQDIDVRKTEPLLEYVRHVHVRNASSDKMQDTMHNGTVDFAWLIPALRERGYQGALSIEYFSGFDKDLSECRALREVLMGLGVEDL